jgi:hypothetical protein
MCTYEFLVTDVTTVTLATMVTMFPWSVISDTTATLVTNVTTDFSVTNVPMIITGSFVTQVTSFLVTYKTAVHNIQAVFLPAERCLCHLRLASDNTTPY